MERTALPSVAETGTRRQAIESIARRLVEQLLHPQHEEAKHYLERIHLDHPETSREFILQQLLLLDLEERGLLRAG